MAGHPPKCPVKPASTPIVNHDAHCYVLLLDGIGSTGAAVAGDFAEITARLREIPADAGPHGFR